MNKNRFNLLGEFQYLAPNGEYREIALAKNIGLIAILLLSREHNRSRGKIMDLLWSDRCNEQGRASLRQSLWSLKQAFGEDANELLKADRKRIYLGIDRCSSDHADFVTLCESGCPAELERAVSLYRGEFLEGLSIRDREWNNWLNNERENLQLLYTGILCKLGNLYLADGNVTRVTKIGRRLVEHDPLCEEGHRFLMMGYSMLNQRTLALKQFERYSKLVLVETEGRPGPSIHNLYEYIKHGVATGGIKRTDYLMGGLNSRSRSVLEAKVTADLKPFLVPGI